MLSTRTPLTYILLLIACLLLHPTSSAVVPFQPLREQFILSDDIVSTSINSLVSTAGAQMPLKITATGNGTVALTEDTAFAKLHLRDTQVQFVKRVSNEMVVVISDERDITLVDIHGLGKSFSGRQTFPFDLTARVRCTDAVLNVARGYLYVLCYSKSGQRTNAYFLKTFDVSSMTLVHSLVKSFPTGFKAQNRLQMFIAQNEDDEFDQSFLVVYDQENSHVSNPDPSLNNFNVLVFRNVVDKNLRFLNLVRLTNSNFRNIYNFYNHQNALIVTGRTTSQPDVLSLSMCKMDPFEDTFSCSSTYKTSTVKEGTIGID